MWVYLYFSLHLLPAPNTHALPFMAHIFMLLLSAFIWFGLVFNEVNFAQPSSSSYKICLKWADLVIFLWRGKVLHPNSQLYLEPDVPGPPLHSAALKGLPVPPLKTCVRHKAHQFLGIITSD